MVTLVPPSAWRHHVADVVEAAEVALAPHDVLPLAEFQETSADVLVALLELHPDVRQGDAVGGQRLGIDDDLVLLLEAAHRRHLAHALDGLQLVLEEEVLDGAELGEIVGARRVAEAVLVDPAHARRVRADGGLGALGEVTGDLVQVLEHPAARPVHVRPVLEDDVDEARPKHRVAPHGLGVGDREHRRRQGVGHLLLDDLRPLPRVFGLDDDLDVGEVGDGVDGRVQRRPRPARDEEAGEEGDQEAVPRAPFDDAF